MRIISTDRQSYFDKFRLSTESLSVFCGSGVLCCKMQQSTLFLAFPGLSGYNETQRH